MSKLDSWVLPTSTEFPGWITQTFVKHRSVNRDTNTETGAFSLFPHQEFVRDYLQHESPYRGLLLYHGLGVGKTCSSIAVAEALLSEREVVVLLPASLRTNYINEIRKCGREEFVKELMYWSFSTKKTIPHLSPSLREKHKGVWIAKSGRPSNFHEIPPNRVAQIDAQIGDIIENTYQFIHYNGVNTNKLKELTKNGKVNPFDGKVIIVDEVHNLVSGVANRARIKSALYNLVLTARDARVVLLSGTPIINHPFEIALLVNLVKGHERSHTFELTSSDVKLSKRAETALAGVAGVTWYTVETDGRKIRATVTTAPEGFGVRRKGAVVRETRALTDEKIVENVHKALRKIDPKVSEEKVEDHLAFPNNESAFSKLFVQEGAMNNADMFTRRALGAVSYFVNDDPRLYPKMNISDEFVEMSEYQYERYTMARKDELKLELNAKRQKVSNKNPFEKPTSVYKAYTRAICNFVFPKELVRPRPRDEDVNDDGEDNTYTRKLDRLVAQVAEQDTLATELSTYSPKFERVMKRVEDSPGPCLIYSQFRRVEGVGLLAKCLEARGFTELKLTYDSDDRWTLRYDPDKPCYVRFKSDDNLTSEQRVEYNTIILNIFNNDFDKLPKNIAKSLRMRTNLRGETVKVMFITQSGAEGISLKNVRQVHVVEPFWNHNRVDQVIGRARRMNSHIALPAEDRNFTVFIYKMRFSDVQRKRTTQVTFMYDNNLTTDEQIADIAARKHRIVSQFLRSLQQAAVDCALHNPKVGCYTFPIPAHSGTVTRAYTLQIEKDFSRSRKTQIVQGKTVYVLTIKRPMPIRRFLYVSNTGELFDAAMYESTGVLQLRGTAKKLDETHYTFSFLA